MAVERRFDPVRFLEEQGNGRSVSVFKAGDYIYRQGDPTDLIYFLQRGKATETVEAGTGKKAIVNMLERGAFFGTAGLDGSQRRISSVAAVTVCVVTSLTREAVTEALNEPRFVRIFLSYLLYHSSQIEADKVDLMLNSNERRLAQKLLDLSHDGTELLNPRITQQMLADMIGTTRQYVNSFMIRFRALGFVQHTGRGIRVDPTLLKVATTQEE